MMDQRDDHPRVQPESHLLENYSNNKLVTKLTDIDKNAGPKLGKMPSRRSVEVLRAIASARFEILDVR